MVHKNRFVGLVVLAVVGVVALAIGAAASAGGSLPGPSNLQVAAKSTTQVLLTWSTAKNVGGYVVLQDGRQIGTTDGQTANYLASGLAPGTSHTFSVEAQNGNVVGSPSSVSVTTGAVAQTISSCGRTLSNGDYVLTTSVTSTGSQCLAISGGGNASLDCRGNAIDVSSYGATALTVNGTSHFLLVNCVLPNSQHNITSLQITGSSQGAIEKLSCKSGQLSAASSSYLVVANNTFSDCSYTQASTTNSFIGANVFANPDQVAVPGFIVSAGGSNNMIHGNRMDGGSYSYTYYNPNASDDGIVLGAYGYGQEDSDTISNNTIQGFFDCGIETLEYVSNTVIANNALTYVNNCGIGAWYWNSWSGNTVTGNTVDYTDRLFAFYNMDGVPSGQSVIDFKDNQYFGNTAGANNGYGINVWLPASYFYMQPYNQPGVNYITGRNVFTNNNFGHGRPTPTLVPSNMIVDGGGNICQPSTVLNCS